MAPNILTAVTAEQLRYEPELGVYIELVIETGFDPEALWYPCPCPYAHDGQHEDRCWLGWIAYPPWAREPTAEVPVILEVPYTDVDLRVADMLADEDETVYLERHHYEPTSDVNYDEAVESVEQWIDATLTPESGASSAEIEFAQDLRALKERSDDAEVRGGPDEHADDHDHGRG